MRNEAYVSPVQQDHYMSACCCLICEGILRHLSMSGSCDRVFLQKEGGSSSALLEISVRIHMLMGRGVAEFLK